MSFDMSQFYQVFFEEAAEHLASMENLLLGLDVDTPDAEQLNAIFRAAHSIKGSAGTFGFTDLAEVTHVLENLLDRIRKGELPLRNDMIDAFLDAGDVLKTLLAAHRGEGAADPALVAQTCSRLNELTGGAADQASAHIAPAAVVCDSQLYAPTAFRITFDLDENLPNPQSVGDNLLAELEALGKLDVLARPANDDKAGWVLRLTANVAPDDISAILEFVATSDSLRVTREGDTVDNPDDAAYGFFEPLPIDVAPPSVEDEAYGFFEPLPAVAVAEAAPASEDYGFFSDAPGAPASVPSPIVAVEEGDGYGFFEPLIPPVSGVAAPAATVVADDPAGAFGFFEPRPVEPSAVLPQATPAASAPTPVAPAAASVAATKATPVAAEATIRVGVEKVDQLINLIGELVITQAMLAQSASTLDPVQFERLHNGIAQLERNTRDMQESVMSIRMMPISTVFSRFPRVVRDLSQKLGKKVELKTIGEGTELDKGLIERIADPLTHLVRNSLDHGVEMPSVREASGKPATGSITLKAYHQSGHIVIEVSDDGAGLNRQKILSKARERGLSAQDGMSDSDVWQLIFEPGFSTADQITEVSGRGVGMDVVKRNITAMGGRVDIESMTGVGTRMTVRLPLTLAILDGMSVAVGRDTYIIPLGYVKESLQVTPGMTKSISGVERLVQVRDEYLPVIVLREVFNIPDAVTAFDKGIMVILEIDGVRAALFVDALVGQHQVVIKSLEANYRKVAGVSGATIMGDGHVALILDVAALVTMARSVQPDAA